MPLVPGDLVGTAARQHGLVTRAQALRAGMSVSAVDALVRTGAWRPIHRGVYLITATRGDDLPSADRRDDTPLPLATIAAAAVLMWGPGVVVSHGSAAELLGFPVLSTPLSWTRLFGIPTDPPRPTVTVTVEPGRRLSASGIKVHRHRLVRKDVVSLSGLPVTSPTRVVFDLMRTAPTITALVVADAAAHRNRAIPGSVAYALAAEAGRRSVRRAGRILDLIEPATESPLETLLRELIRLAGLPPPVPQYEVRATNGELLARVDFAYPSHGLVIEGDGRRHHESWTDGVRDRRRQNLLVNAGFRILRFTWDDVWNRPHETVTTIRGALPAANSGVPR